MYSILTIIGGFYHKYKDNFDYITPIVKSLRIFTALKLEKLTNKLKPRANSVVNPFTEDELNRCIYLIKMQLIADLELEAFFSKSKNKEKIIQVLNVDEGADSKEVYLYVLKFILYDVDYSPYIAIHPKKLKYLDSKIRPSLQKSNETMKEPESIEIEQEMILDKCKNVLSSINPYYNKYRLMFQTRCTSLFEKCIDIQEIRNKIMSKYPIRVPETTLDVNVEDVDIRGIERKDALATLFRKWYSYNSQDKKEFWLRYFNVVFKGEAGIFTGPGRELIQICLQSIQEELGDLFIPVDSGSKRMMLHPDFKPTTRFLEKAKIKEWNLEIKKEIVQFIGGLFTRALLLNIEIPISLSYYTLSYLYYKNNIEDDTYGFYYLIDMPDASKDQFKLMEMDPDTIEYVDLNFNDVYPLIKEDELITKDNVTKYINSIAKYSLTKPDQPEYKELLDAFFKGFLLKRTFLLDNGINIRYLDKLLNESGGTINEKKLKQFIDTRLNFELSKKLDETAPFEEKEKRAKLIKHQEQIKEWFIKLLNTNGTDFPYEKIGIDKPTTEEKQKVFALSDFLPKLMYFWTSSYNINLFDSYIVNIYQSDIVNKLPSAHTCVKTIDIPSSYTSYNELFEKLATAVYNTQGFAFAGGDMINKCIQKVLKNNLLNKDHNKAIQVGLITMIKSHKQLTKKQKKKLIKYVENEAINFKIATKREIKQWGKQLCKQMKMI
jgi:hypothetical protein